MNIFPTKTATWGYLPFSNRPTNGMIDESIIINDFPIVFTPAVCMYVCTYVRMYVCMYIS